VQILKGRWGPFITDGKKNARMPKDREVESLTLEECVAAIEAAPDKRRGKKAAKKKTVNKKVSKKRSAKKTGKKKSSTRKKTTKKKTVKKAASPTVTSGE
jgi:DNA topoisomerase-1